MPASETPSFYAASDLTTWLLAKFGQYETNRAKYEEKWTQNREIAESILAMAWREGEGNDWRTDTVSNMGRNKIMTALAIMMDTALAGGRVPFMLVPVGVPQGFEQEAASRAAHMEEYMRWQQETTNEDRELRRCCRSGLEYGPGWNRFTVKKVRVLNPKPFGGEGMAGEQGAEGYIPADMGQMRWDYQATEELIPASFTPSIWNMFWDYEERDIADMEMVIERDYITVGVLRKFKDKVAGGYIPDAIEKVLRDHPRDIMWGGDSGERHGVSPGEHGTSQDEPRRDYFPEKTHSIRRLKIFGLSPRVLVEAFEARMAAGDNATQDAAPVKVDEAGDDVEIMAEIAGREIIRMMRIEHHEWPYDYWMAEETLDEVGARGIADNTCEAWKEETGYLRAALDNGNLAGNLVFKRLPHKLKDEIKKFFPGCFIDGNETCDKVDDIGFDAMVIPDITGPLLAGQKGAQDRGDTDSGVPRLLQGMSSLGSNPTATEVQEITARSMQTFGQFMRNYDDGRIEPMEQRRLEYNQDDVRLADMWGPYKVQALGFAGFQGRIVRYAKIKQALQLIFSDATGESMRIHKLKAIWEEIWKEADIDPERVMRTEEEQQAQVAQELARQQQMAMSQDRVEADSRKAALDKVQQHNQAQQITAAAQSNEIPGEMPLPSTLTVEGATA